MEGRPLEEAQLIERAKHGEVGAYEELVRRYQQLALSTAYVVAGDAAGLVNPFNGEGISLAYETGRLAADAVDLALMTGNGLALQTYDDRLEEVYGLYFKFARLFVRAIGNPAVMRELSRVGMHSRTLMEWALRIMANLLRPDELGPAEAAYRAVAALARLAP